MEPIRNILRHKKGTVKYYEAEATKIDYEKRVVHISDGSEITGDVSRTEVPFDMLVVAVGAENATFGKSMAKKKNVQERRFAHALFQVFPESRSTLAS